MYANWRIENGQGVGSVVLLGPTFDAYNEQGDHLDTFEEWSPYIANLLDEDVDVLVINDGLDLDALVPLLDMNPAKANPNANGTGTYTYWNVFIDHNDFGRVHTGTNNSVWLRDDVYNWIAK
jgi:hypothetical protein